MSIRCLFIKFGKPLLVLNRFTKFHTRYRPNLANQQRLNDRYQKPYHGSTLIEKLTQIFDLINLGML